MAAIDAVELRRGLEGPHGYAFTLQRDFDAARAARGLANSAHVFLTDAVECHLLRMLEPAQQLTAKAALWLQSAIQESEVPSRYTAYATEARRLEELALARWLNNSEPDMASLEASANEWVQWLLPLRKSRRADLAAALPTLLEAARTSEVRELLQRGNFKTEPAGVQLRSEQQVAFAVINSTVSERDLRRATVFRASVPQWINGGRAVHVAKWAKFLYKSSPHAAGDALLEFVHMATDAV